VINFYQQDENIKVDPRKSDIPVFIIIHAPCTAIKNNQKEDFS
jgi:hypothetical protein